MEEALFRIRHCVKRGERMEREQSWEYAGTHKLEIAFSESENEIGVGREA